MDKTGDDIEIGFNSKFVIDVLKAIDDEEIRMIFRQELHRASSSLWAAMLSNISYCR